MGAGHVSPDVLSVGLSSDGICWVGELSKNGFYYRRMNPHRRKRICLFLKLTFTRISQFQVLDGPVTGILEHRVQSVDATTVLTVTPVETRLLTSHQSGSRQLYILYEPGIKTQYLETTIPLAIALKQSTRPTCPSERPYIQVVRSLRP